MWVDSTMETVQATPRKTYDVNRNKTRSTVAMKEMMFQVAQLPQFLCCREHLNVFTFYLASVIEESDDSISEARPIQLFFSLLYKEHSKDVALEIFLTIHIWHMGMDIGKLENSNGEIGFWINLNMVWMANANNT